MPNGVREDGFFRRKTLFFVFFQKGGIRRGGDGGVTAVAGRESKVETIGLRMNEEEGSILCS